MFYMFRNGLGSFWGRETSGYYAMEGSPSLPPSPSQNQINVINNIILCFICFGRGKEPFCHGGIS